MSAAAPESVRWAVELNPFACCLLKLVSPGDPAVVLLANAKFQTLTGPAALPAPVHSLLGFDAHAPAWPGVLDAVAVLGQQASCDIRAYRKIKHGDPGAEPFWASVQLNPLDDDIAGPGQFALMTVQDASATHQVGEELAQLRQRTVALQAELDEGILIVDSSMQISQVNPSAARMLGLEAAHAVGRHVSDIVRLVDTTTGNSFNNPMVTAILVGIDAGWTQGVALLRPDGSHQAVAFCTQVVRDSDGLPVEAVLLLRNVEQEGVVLASLAHQAGHDLLTGLVLRPVFDDRLAQALALSERHGRRSALILVNLAGLAEARLQWGHGETDNRLKLMAEQLLNLFRRSDTLCRYDEDHFALVLTHLDDGVSSELLLRKLTRIACDAPLHLHAALSFYPQHGESADALLAHCNAQLLAAAAPR